MRPLMLLTIALLLASPAIAVDILEVHISFDDVEILDVVAASGADPYTNIGDWRVQVRDDDRVVLYENSFDPYLIGPDAAPKLIDETYVDVQTAPGATEVSVLDPDGKTVATHRIRTRCGDGVCSENERLSCETDCGAVTESEETVERLESESVSAGFPLWKKLVLGSSVFLLIVLILVLIHLNRSKENPVKMASSEQYYQG